MRISWNWLSEMVDLSGVNGPTGLAQLLTQRGLEVEEIHSPAQGLEKVITVKILERNKHPEADRLSVCKVSLGTGEPLEIVCGAQNMKAGDIVALAQIGAQIPNGLKIEKSKIRGVVSNGMLCSEEELKLKDESDGILILPPETPLGQPLADTLGLNDTVLTFKLTANRGDCLSHFGMAREVASALGQIPKAPPAATVPFDGSNPISISLNAGEGAPQFYGIAIEGVKVAPSTQWVAKRLEALGSRSINNVVDATNLVMLELGHPMHAYDADRIEGRKIGVRLSKDGEKLPLLDGSEITLNGSELVIEDGSRAIGLAGVMGGGNSEVQDTTTRLFLECAEFAPVLVRRASSRHQKKTEAAHRFERGVDPSGLRFAVSRMAQLIIELAGGKITGSSVKMLPSRDPKIGMAPGAVTVRPSYFSDFLGMDLSQEQIEKVLQDQKCRIEKIGAAGSDHAEWKVTPPSYRLDITIKEDLAEEVARSVGYDKIPSTVPQLTSQPTASAFAASSSGLILIDRAKDALVQAGMEEAVNLGFASPAWLRALGFQNFSRLMNPLSEDLEALVPSLLPGLIRNALDNWRHHFGSESLPIRLFELRPTFSASGEVKALSETDTGMQEKWKLAMAVSGPRFAQSLRIEQGQVDFYDVKAVTETLFEGLGTKGIRFIPITQSRATGNPVLGLFHPGQSVEILAGNAVAGYLGLLHPGKAKALKTRAPLWIAELDWGVLTQLSRPASESRTFKAWSEFPPMERDFAIVVKNDVTADKITQVAAKAGKPLAKVVKIFDIYRGSQVPQGMTSVAVRVIFFNEGRSLQETETEAASAQILEAWKKELGAELRG